MHRVHILRKSSGGSMALVTMATAILLIVFLVGLCFMVFSELQSKNKDSADRLALAMGIRLNDTNRIGQMNKALMRCRELVYNSQQVYDEAHKNSPIMEPIAKELLDRARLGARKLEMDQNSISKSIVRECMDISTGQKSETSTPQAVQILSLKTTKPEISEVKLGYANDVPSNITTMDVIDDLAKYDLSQKYADKDSHFYFANIDAKLPAPNNDLNFRLSSLRPVIGKEADPANLISVNDFIACGSIIKDGKPSDEPFPYLPSAVQVTMNMNVVMELFGTQKQNARTTSAACSASANVAK